MKLLANTAILLLTIFGLHLHSANAQVRTLGDCTCLTAPNAASNSALGNISGANGNVLYSDLTGFKLATPGAQLLAGSQISVGADASAIISVGLSCKLSVPASSIVIISQSSGPGTEICVKLSDDPTDVAFSTHSPAATASTTLSPLPIILGAGIGLAIWLGGGDDPASN